MRDRTLRTHLPYIIMSVITITLILTIGLLDPETIYIMRMYFFEGPAEMMFALLMMYLAFVAYELWSEKKRLLAHARANLKLTKRIQEEENQRWFEHQESIKAQYLNMDPTHDTAM